MNFYLKCAETLKLTRLKKGNFKTILFDLLNKRKISSQEFQKAYPIVIRAMSNMGILDNLIVHLRDHTKKFTIKNMDLLRILLSELFLGKYKKIKGGGKLKKTIMDNYEVLKNQFEVSKTKFGIKEEAESEGGIILKKRVYIRIVKNQMNLQGLKNIISKQELEFDDLIPGLIKLQYAEYQLLKKSEHFKQSQEYIVQSKSSCLPPYLLCKWLLKKKDAIKKKIDIIDACSAPGNKTTQLAEYWPKGKIFAIERDIKRFHLLEQRTQFYGFENITCLNDSFLNLDPSDNKYKYVRFIMVDPTCSGSGMINNIEKENINERYEREEFQGFCEDKFNKLNKEGKEKLNNLQLTQLELISHAAKFPNVLRISYSTCSIYEVENELVVEQFLKDHKEFDLVNLSKIGLTQGFTKNFYDGYKCLRADPLNDEMDGFFVAIFKRRKDISSKSEFHQQDNNLDRQQEIL